MRALRCDICGKFFDPVEDAAKYKRAGEKVTNRFALLESCEGGHEFVTSIDICHECVSNMFDAVNFRVPISKENQNGNEIQLD